MIDFIFWAVLIGILYALWLLGQVPSIVGGV